MMLLGTEDCVVIQKEPRACCGHLRLFSIEGLRRSLLAPLVFFFFFLLIVLSAEMAYTDLLVLCSAMIILFAEGTLARI